MLIGKLILGMPNVMLLDEPTNHLDMESIESLNTALDRYPGTLVFDTLNFNRISLPIPNL